MTVFSCLLSCLTFTVLWCAMKHVSYDYFLELSYFLCDHCCCIDSPLWSAMKAVSFNGLTCWLYGVPSLWSFSSLYKDCKFSIYLICFIELSYLICDHVTISLWCTMQDVSCRKSLLSCGFWVAVSSLWSYWNIFHTALLQRP